MGNNEDKDTAAVTVISEGWLVVGGILVVLACLLVFLYAIPPTPTPPDGIDHSKAPWDRIPQASEGEAETFATTFLQALGYTLAGIVSCPTWTVDMADHKQYRCYAVYNPALAPLQLTCGPATSTATQPLRCVIDSHG